LPFFRTMASAIIGIILLERTAIIMANSFSITIGRLITKIAWMFKAVFSGTTALGALQ
jgi:hypothetical protein